MNLKFTDHPFTIGRILAGRFRIVRPLGYGGMGAVFEVEHQLTRHHRALKLLHPQMAEMPAVVERFLREASAAGRIGNGHIVETFDAGRLETGEPYIVMELLQGRTLAELLREVGPLDMARSCDLLLQACDGVGAAHAAGIIHRDLKPENLFLAAPSESFVKILDFGISKFDAAITGVEGLTLEGSPMGTPYYMSPEQVNGQRPVDAQTDVYALGVVFYECLTARRPFEADTLPQLILQIAQGRYVAPSQVRPQLPTLADEIVSRAMAMDPASRFASTQELSRAILSLQAAQDRNLVSSGAHPGPSTFPPIESTHVLPAMTPGVFSRSSVPRIATSLNPSRRKRTWVVLGATLAALLALGLSLWAGVTRPSDTTPSGATLPLSAPNSPHAIATSPNVVVPLVRGTPSVSAPDSTTRPEPSAITTTPASPRDARPSTSAIPSHSTRARPAPATGSQTSRAASQGLAEDNPFK
jgi:serine/threonine-protein kinase